MTTDVETAPITSAQAFQQVMREELARDHRIVVIGTGVSRGGDFASLQGLGSDFGPDRLRDASISEAGIVAVGIGAALTGLRPVVELHGIDFALGAGDEIVNQAAKIRFMHGTPVPMVIAGAFGVAGYAAQHTNNLEAWFCNTPGLTVVAPSRAADVAGLLRAALRVDDPVVFLTHKRLVGARSAQPPPGHVLEIGRAAVIRPGTAVTAVSYSYPLTWVERAAVELATEGIDVEVIDLRTLRPLDVHTVLTSVHKTGHLVIVTEAPPYGGVAAELAASVQERAFFDLDGPIIRLMGVDAPISHSVPLLDAAVPTVDEIKQAIRACVTDRSTGIYSSETRA